MIIDYRDVRKHDGVLAKHEQVLVPEVAKTHTQVENVSPLDVRVNAQLVNHLCKVEGTVKYSVTYLCTRCLESFVAHQETELFEEFTEDKNQVTEEVHHAPDGIAVLDPWIEQSLNLDLEFFPVCRSDCRGLCPVCGINRNEHECNCDVRTVDPRLGVLSDLLSTDESE
ncbi:YceD family protein [Alicyclobacillus mengziensis]|uniref:DUF177 domain-containing protein n=1 Tax=Alicyclobacillus mengziensis TaxID=2931921 RepID=A0A9X7W2P7_9BACL|nr:DUF177 domain-containing protein [Alicyclobacillus mengziensis]QSO49524.1 DUF177 domain-containing protein [Alicyclobacillus mengziensis]